MRRELDISPIARLTVIGSVRSRTGRSSTMWFLRRKIFRLISRTKSIALDHAKKSEL